MKCRHCYSDVKLTFVDLGMAPPSNAYLTKETIKLNEQFFPLKVLVCEQCWLVQTEDFLNATEVFNHDYAYFSSYSDSWLLHCKQYVDVMINRFKLNINHLVIEVAANDGYLLQYFKNYSIPCIGIEPTASTAEAARKKGISIIEDFFGTNLSKKLVSQNKQADLIIANNVLAHVPDINDFVSGFTTLLKPNGIATFEFPYLLQLIKNMQFDTIYHEHFSYFSLSVIDRIFSFNGLEVFDVEEIPTHGGSLRLFAKRKHNGNQIRSSRVMRYLEDEKKLGVLSENFYTRFQYKIEKIKNNLVNFLLEAKKEGKKVAGYGAAAKGNTLINYAAINQDLISYIVDRNPAKQEKFTPGSHIPIVDENQFHLTKPDYVLILPWNLKHEIIQQINYIREWCGKFVIAIPDLEIIS